MEKGLYPSPRVEIEVDVDGRGLDPSWGRNQSNVEGHTLLLVSKLSGSPLLRSKVKIEVNVGGGGAYPPSRIEIKVNKDGGGLYPPPGVEIETMWVEERCTLLLGSKSR